MTASRPGITSIEQVRLLTEGLPLPLPAIGERPLKVIANRISMAWRDILDTHAGSLLRSDEPQITAMLCTRLNRLIEEDEQWAQLVQKVSRGEESINFNGESIEDRPDLALKLTSRNGNFPLIIECKLIDPRARKHAWLYCRKGISRFLNGNYAWATQEAFMLGYVQDQSTIDCQLTPYLRRHQRKSTDLFSTIRLPEAVGGVMLGLRRSLHGRRFRYPERSPGDPGAISIWHLWLYR